MSARSKVVELGGRRFELRRLPPEQGSFILMKMMGVAMRAAAKDAEGQAPQAQQQETETPVIDSETKVRALVFSVFSGGLGFDDFKFVQNACLRCASVVNESGLPIPLMNDFGEWTNKDMAEDVGLVMKLTSEVLVFCFAGFFDGGSPGLI